MVQAGPPARALAARPRLVEEHLRTSCTVGAVVERPARRCHEPLPQSEDRHQLVVVLLSSAQVGHRDADVIDEPRPRHGCVSPDDADARPELSTARPRHRITVKALYGFVMTAATPRPR